ncbi:MAG TPA: HVO_0476 family zinc finger protein, partial [Thermoplasmata archaeon]
ARHAMRNPMAAPSALVLKCESCGKEVPHRVLRGRVAGRGEFVFEGIVKCTACGSVRNVVTREVKPIDVPLILSWMDKSTRKTIEMGPDEVITVGSDLTLEEGRARITAIESKARHVQEAKASDVTAIWAKRSDKVWVPFSVNRGNRTVSRKVLAAPDEEFYVKDIVDVGRERVLVNRIRTRQSTLQTGSAMADEIVRVYGTMVRERTSH